MCLDPIHLHNGQLIRSFTLGIQLDMLHFASKLVRSSTQTSIVAE